MPVRLSISALLDALLPSACLLCSGTAAGPAGLTCARCDADLPRLSVPACPVCATPLGTAATASCGHCLRSPPAYDATIAGLRYAYPVDRLVHGLKFGHRLAIAHFFAERLLQGNRPVGDLLLPVPLAAARLAERGFNQAVEIARPLAQATGLVLDSRSLVRIRNTPPQSRLPWRMRQRNVRSAFECHGDVAGKAVVLVDDVMTTGATLDAIARCLKDHGATRVTNWVAVRSLRNPT